MMNWRKTKLAFFLEFSEFRYCFHCTDHFPTCLPPYKTKSSLFLIIYYTQQIAIIFCTWHRWISSLNLFDKQNLITLNLSTSDLRLWTFDLSFSSSAVNSATCKSKKRLYPIKEVLVYLLLLKLDLKFKTYSCHGDFTCSVSSSLTWVSWSTCIRTSALSFTVIILLYGFICCHFCF